jgi:hypothetical protein
VSFLFKSRGLESDCTLDAYLPNKSPTFVFDLFAFYCMKNCLISIMASFSLRSCSNADARFSKLAIRL